MAEDTKRSPKNSHGLPTSLVMIGALVLLTALLGAVYIIGNELGGKIAFDLNTTRVPTDALSSSAPARVAARPVERRAPAAEDPGEERAESRLEIPKSDMEHEGTISLGGYVVHGAQTLIFKTVRSKLFPEKKILLTTLNFANQAQKSAPNMAIIMSFIDLERGCTADNIASVDLSFNLPLGRGAPAQKAGLSLKDPQKIGLALNETTCSLTKGGRLDLHLLGQENNLLNPDNGTFAWGIKLSQTIE